MTNKTITDYNAASGIDPINDYLLIESLNVYYKINRNTVMGVTGTPADLSTTQTFTNKVFGNTNSITVKDGSFTLQNSSGVTKQAVFSLSSITAGQTRTITVPDASLTLVGTTTTQTLTNKTITGAAISGGTIDNSTITVDSIAGHTSSTIVTVANLQISNGVLNSANAVTATSIAAGAVQPQALTSGAGTGWSMNSFTPTWTNITVGNGTSQGYYIQIGKIVFVTVEFILGTTSSVGTSPNFTPPVGTVSSHYNTSTVFYNMGGFVGVAGSTAFTGYFNYGANGSNKIYVYNSSGATITATTPGTWAAGNYIAGQFWYEVT